MACENPLGYVVTFVTSIPVSGAAVTGTFDFTSGKWCLTKETRFDPPPKRRAEVSTMLADGTRYPADVYDNRVIELRAVCVADDTDDLAREIQRLLRELEKPFNTLMVRPSTTEEVYFRTFSVSPDALQVVSRRQNVARVSVDLLAEPYGYGRPESRIFVVSVDPAVGPNPGYFDVTGVRGDVPAATIIDDQFNFFNVKDVTMAIRRRGDPSKMPYLRQCEDMDQNVDTSTRPGGASYSGTGINPLANPGFENPLNVTKWTSFRGTLTRDTTQFRSGLSSARYDADPAVTGTRFIESDKFSVSPSVASTGRAWVRAGTNFTTAQIKISWFTSADVLISTTVGGSVTLSTTWQELVASATSPATAAKASIIVEYTPDPGASGGSVYNDDVSFTPGHNYSQTTFTTDATMRIRLTDFIPDPGFETSDARGTYRVLLRYKRSSSSGDINLHAYGVPGNGYVGAAPLTATSVATRKSSSFEIADLGLLQIPWGLDPVYYGPSGQETVVVQNAVALEIRAERLSGSSTIDFDFVLLMPADDQFMMLDVGNEATYAAVFDSYADMGYGYDEDINGIDSSTDIIPIGAIIEVKPNVTNRIFLRAGDRIEGTPTDIKLTWWPRYLFLRPELT